MWNSVRIYGTTAEVFSSTKLCCEFGIFGDLLVGIGGCNSYMYTTIIQSVESVDVYTELHFSIPRANLYIYTHYSYMDTHTYHTFPRDEL